MEQRNVDIKLRKIIRKLFVKELFAKFMTWLIITYKEKFQISKIHNSFDFVASLVVTKGSFLIGLQVELSLFVGVSDTCQPTN